jgi:hypothetical protein
MQADHGLLKNPHDGLVQTFESAEVDGNFAVEHFLLIGMASFTGHSAPSLSVGRNGTDGIHHALFEIEHLRRENDAGGT